MAKTFEKLIPLVLDFDGTLHRGDMTWEAVAYGLRHNVWAVVMFVVTLLLKGKAAGKMVLENAFPYICNNKVSWIGDMVDYARAAEAEGRPVWVATGSSEAWVKGIVKAAGYGWGVMGTKDDTVNLTGPRKAAALVKRFGVRGFDYAGNSADDLPVWAVARQAIVVNAPRGVSEQAVAQGNVVMEFAEERNAVRAVVKAMRPHQWLKNMLVFVPIVTAHQWASPLAWLMAGGAFVAFSLCASGVYVLNDMVDIQDDRAHPRKRNRPLAAGTLSVPLAMVLVVALTALAVGVAAMVGWPLVAVLGVYWASTLAYSLGVKSIPMADVVVLAGLYCIRVVAGGAATGIEISVWLMLCAMFGFYSLANMKRVIELRALVVAAKGKTRARGYDVADLPLVAAQGVSSGLMAVMVLALYLQSPAVAPLYSHPVWLGLICPVALWWLARAWLLAWRGELHDDPVVFAATDASSWLVLAAALAVMVGAV